ncbi:hypothetical protein Nepgr_023626 [Nepenthes gracilis]|uniref:Defensin-like protein n=1 Tax=Nepenthes gracilis TaxID=150966 RepID=A0AAD3T3E6_NEPGR|nr:hypothetical protein Nepgr_023626 [Nepenthes gracilis]
MVKARPTSSILILLLMASMHGPLLQNVEGFICFEKIESCDNCWTRCSERHKGGEGACESSQVCRCYWPCPQAAAEAQDTDSLPPELNVGGATCFQLLGAGGNDLSAEMQANLHGPLLQNVEGFICFEKIESCDNCWTRCSERHKGGEGACESSQVCRCYWPCPQAAAEAQDTDSLPPEVGAEPPQTGGEPPEKGSISRRLG